MKNFFKKLALVLALAMVVTVVAPAAASKSEAASVAISKKEAKVSIGKSYNFNVKNKVAGSKYAWSSSDESVATVKSNGVAKGLKVGEATISCKITLPNKKTTTVKGTLVVCPDATKVTINNEPATVELGASFDFNRDIEPKNTVNKTYWVVKDAAGKVIADTKAGTGAAIMSEKGVFTPVALGSYTITAQASRSKTATKMRGEADTVKVEVVMPTLKSAEVVAATFDDDTKGQALSIKVNGIATTVAELVLKGYNVLFETFDSANKAIKDDSIVLAATGAINPEIALKDTADTYKVKVTVSKGNEIVTSALTTIVITNKDVVTTTTGKYEFTLNGQKLANTTLVVNAKTKETAAASKLTFTINGVVDTLDANELKLVKVASSDVAVATVENKAGAITVAAKNPGNVNITLTYNDHAIVVPFTVVAKDRVVTSYEFTAASYTAVVDNVSKKHVPADAKVLVKDQYGELKNVVDAKKLTVVTTNNNIAEATIAQAKDSKGTDIIGTYAVTINPKALGSTAVYVKYDDVAVASATVVVQDDLAVYNTVLEIVKKTGQSDDYVLDIANTADNKVELALVQYNKNGVKVGEAKATVALAPKADKDIASVKGLVVTAGTKAGSVDIVVTDTTTNVTYGATVTVINSAVKLTNVTTKAVATVGFNKSVNLTNVFDLTKTSDSYGWDLAGATFVNRTDSCDVRVDLNGKVYIDYNNDGQLDDKEEVGQIAFEIIADANKTAPKAGKVVDTYTIGATDKGAIVYKITNNAGEVVAKLAVYFDGSIK